MTTTLHQHIKAPRSKVFAALLDPKAIAHWKVPDGMKMQVHLFEPWEGGNLRISLTYEATDAIGKTSAHTDTYRGTFEKLVQDEEVVELDEFETTTPELQGAMRISFRLLDAAGHTDLVATHEGLPSGVSAKDNETGWRMALSKLARLVEEHN